MKQKKPPIPGKMEMLSLGEPGYTRQQWMACIQDRVRELRKELRKKGSDQRIGMSEPMVKRRTEALLDSMPYIERRYGSLPGLQPAVSNALGNAWVHLNILASTSYNALASESYLLYAAVLWILDRLDELPDGLWKMQEFLPDGEEDPSGMDWPPFWDAYYECDLIQSVAYAVENRNADIEPLEIDASQNKRVFNSNLSAKGKHHKDVESRRNFERIIAMIPQERIDTAVEHFQILFSEWLDQYFNCLSLMECRKAKCVKKANAIAEEYNRYREELISLLNRPSEKQKKTVNPPVSPLVMNPPSAKPSFASPEEMLKSISLQNRASFPASMGPEFSVPDSRLASLFHAPEQGDSLTAHLMDIARKMEQTIDRNRAASEELDAVVDQISIFTYNMSIEGTMSKEYCAEECGEDVAAQLREIKVSDPFELCFALLYLIDDPQLRAGASTEEKIDVFDLPWLYGAGTSFMQLIVQALPWAFDEYVEEYDPVWWPDEEEGKQLSFIQDTSAATGAKKPCLPDFFERRFTSDEEEQRSLAQLIYEETGCVVPRNMEKYAGRVKELRKKGARSKDLPVLLSMITLSGYAQRQHKRIKPDHNAWMEKSISGEENDQEHEANGAQNEPEAEKNWTKEELLDKMNALREQAAQYQEQIKRLRAITHELEQKNQRTEKTLSDTKADAEMERRELADLRDLIFNQKNGAEEETEEEIQDASFPYEVQQDTLIFGGHKTWLRTIHQLLKGNIRFIDKDLIFDVSIVRHAERIWIQPNALSHTQYYRIMDTARTFHKPVRYFAYASAVKCARQLMDSDS